MELTRVILGPVTTEKSERLKTERTFTFRVHPQATKIDIRNALKKFYDVDVTSLRVQNVRTKTRAIGSSRTLTKRHASKRVMVTIAKDGKALDISKFATS